MNAALDSISRAACQAANGNSVGLHPEWKFFSPTSLEGVDVPERKFIVDGWLPSGTVSLNYGDGGVGKTLLAQQLMTSTATGLPWCGLAVTRCRSIALFCEDDGDELHRRQDAINTAYGVRYENLGDMLMTSGVGMSNTLVEFDRDGRMHFTDAYGLLRDRAIAHRAELIIVDTAADTFGGNENTRREVRLFIGRALGALAIETGAAVLLNAHPSRSGMGPSGDLDGGSTAWSNTARSRWSLTRPKAEGDQAPDTDTRVLSKRKANYGSIGDTIKLRWQRGVLVPIHRPGGLSAMVAQGEADATFLALLARFESVGVRVSQSKNGENYAPKFFAKAPDCNGHTKDDFEAALGRLLQAGKVSVHDFGRAGRPQRGLVVTA